MSDNFKAIRKINGVKFYSEGFLNSSVIIAKQTTAEQIFSEILKQMQINGVITGNPYLKIKQFRELKKKWLNE